MAEVARTALDRPAWWVPYRTVLRSRLRAQRSYRASFVVDLITSGVNGLVELAAVWVLFGNVDALGGLDFAAVLLVFGLGNIGFSAAEVVVGHVDTLPTFLRAGTLDVYYLRPQPLLAQVITTDIQLRRLARVGVGLVSAVIALCVNDIAWSVGSIAMIGFSLVFGTIIYAALFVTAGGLQFFLINGPEATNSFVYGGSNASTQPASVWPKPLTVVFGFLFPVTFCAYLPALVILDLPGPPMLPSWLAWLLPVAALWASAVAAAAWRIGVRHYQGGGG